MDRAAQMATRKAQLSKRQERDATLTKLLELDNATQLEWLDAQRDLNRAWDLTHVCVGDARILLWMVLVPCLSLASITSAIALGSDPAHWVALVSTWVCLALVGLYLLPAPTPQRVVVPHVSWREDE